MKLFSLFDFFIVLIFAAVSFFLFFNIEKEESDYFEIYYGEKKIEIPITKDTIITVNSVEIEFKNKSAKIIKSNCLNQICVAAKPIDGDGQIICAPNKVAVLIHKKKTKIDVYAY
ncbi:MAG: NusG domain II-containing protein [Chitinispirillales bacterium]|jgi:hypothetical protein|nr:NusG domain II-containing protein [Chitinispirillales bacterium]